MNNAKLTEQWDWALLYYLGTVVLNMTEEEFWKCTPRKLFALLNIHGEVSGVSESLNKITEQSQAVKQFMNW
jgi:uncharacterized phage protein (TIGR02216 family)